MTRNNIECTNFTRRNSCVTKASISEPLRTSFVFAPTSLQDAEKNFHCPELSGKSIRWEMFFDRALGNVTEIIVLAEIMSTVKNDQFGTICKNV